MNKQKKAIITICITIGAILVMVITVMAATSNPIVEKLAEKKRMQSGDVRKIESGSSDNSNSEEYDLQEMKTQFNNELIKQYELAVDKGYVYQYEIYLDENNAHNYRFLHAFSSDELASAIFEDSYSILRINESRYYVKWGYLGDYGEADADLPSIEEGAIILRVFSEDNWNERNEILAQEMYLWVKNTVVNPIAVGDIAQLSNSDNSIEHIFTKDEVQGALVSENGIFVKINDDVYVINYVRDESGNNGKKIVLKSLEGYMGDAKVLDPDSYQFYPISEWLID